MNQSPATLRAAAEAARNAAAIWINRGALAEAARLIAKAEQYEKEAALKDETPP